MIALRFNRALQQQRQYTDRVTILRTVQVKRRAETILEHQLIYTNLPCRISQTRLARNGQTTAENQIEYDAKLFCAANVDIQQGDIMQVTRASVTRQYVAGEPFLYDTHQEIGLLRKERA